MKIGRFALIKIDNPPANALSLELRMAIADGLRAARTDPDIDGIVIAGSDKAFCSGADIRQFGTPAYWAAPRTRDLVALMDDVGKPVVVAIGGFAMGGGLELAMAAHLRIALPGSLLGLPEVRLGVIPAAGGILRLPRLVQAGKALEMMMSGDALKAEDAHAIGLIDMLAKGDLREAAFALLEQAVGRKDLVRTIDRPVLSGDHDPRRNDPELWRDPARKALLKCFHAALKLSPEHADALIQQESNRLVDSPEAHALRHIFFGKRSVSGGSSPGGARAAPLRNVAVIGAGERADAVRRRVEPPDASPNSMRNADLVLELDAAPEEGRSRARIRLEGGSASGTAVQEMNILLRGVNPMPELMEYLIDDGCHPDALATLIGFGRRLGMTPVPVRRLGIGDRLWRRAQAAAREMLTEEIRASTLDSVLAGWGFAQPLLSAAAGDDIILPEQKQSEIIKHCMYAMVNESRSILADQLVESPVAIDIILVTGYGFPASRGGPIHWMNHLEESDIIRNSAPWT